MQKTPKNDQILRKFRLDLDIEGDLGKLLELTVLKVWLNGWVFVYELSDCGFESCWYHLNFRYGAWFVQALDSSLTFR